MKKHLVNIVNILLIVCIISAVAFVLIKSTKKSNNKTETVSSSVNNNSATFDTALSNKKFVVGVVRHINNEDTLNCYNGFVEELKTLGCVDNIEIINILEEDENKCEDEINKLVEKGVDLIYTIGPFASKTAAKLTSSIPIVFAAVDDPEEIGLVSSNEVPGANITGVSSYTPCFEQIDIIKILIPKAKEIAAIYSQTDESSVMQTIIAQKEAESAEVNLKLTKYPVDDSSDIYSQLESIYKDGTDVIYVPIDKLIKDNLSAITEFSLENSIPVICGDEAMLKNDCFATCIINYTSIGEKSADIAYAVLYMNEPPASIPVIYKYDCYNYINKEVMNKLKINLTDEAKSLVKIRSYAD